MWSIGGGSKIQEKQIMPNRCLIDSKWVLMKKIDVVLRAFLEAQVYNQIKGVEFN